MIPIAAAPRPAAFEADVSQPGAAFLRAHPVVPPVPSGHWKGREYWGKARGDIWDAYGGICAYSCIRIDPESAHWGTIDHFKPKTTYPDLAYEWDNLRLASTVPNSAKGNHEDVLDPFVIGEGWFAIDEVDLEVIPGPNAPPGQMDAIEKTIARLKLNREEHVESRRLRVARYLRGTTALVDIEADAPFLAREIIRWGLVPEP